MIKTMKLPFIIVLSSLLLQSSQVFARVMDNDPLGFHGIQWGKAISDRSEFIHIESGEHIDEYALKDASPQIGGIAVRSMKFITIDDRFAQVIIHYQGQTTHQSILDYLESQYGTIDLMPGAMMRGLNQQYTWRGSETEISVMYRGLGERGFLTLESRLLAPRIYGFTCGSFILNEDQNMGNFSSDNPAQAGTQMSYAELGFRIWMK